MIANHSRGVIPKSEPGRPCPGAGAARFSSRVAQFPAAASPIDGDTAARAGNSPARIASAARLQARLRITAGTSPQSQSRGVPAPERAQPAFLHVLRNSPQLRRRLTATQLPGLGTARLGLRSQQQRCEQYEPHAAEEVPVHRAVAHTRVVTGRVSTADRAQRNDRQRHQSANNVQRMCAR